MTTIVEEWRPYLEARGTGIKQRWKPLLEQRIAALHAINSDEMPSYIDGLFRAYFDDGHADIPLQHPAIWRLGLDRLTEGINSESPEHLIWAFKARSFQGVWEILPEQARSENPRTLLQRVLELVPHHQTARELLFLDYLDALDFAQHELPDYLCVDEDVCTSMIQACEALLTESPALANVKTRFGGGFEHYRAIHEGWLRYQDSKPDMAFFDWLAAQH